MATVEILLVKPFGERRHAVVRDSQAARCDAIHCSARESAFGRSSHVRTRPDLVERTTPPFSSTERCFMNDGSAIANGAASVDTDAGPRRSAPTIARRVGSASAAKTIAPRQLVGALLVVATVVWLGLRPARGR